MVVVLQREKVFNFSKNCLQPSKLHTLLRVTSKSAKVKIFQNSQLVCTERKIIAEHLFDLCTDCLKMAALPQAAFAACKLRDMRNERDLIIARMMSGGDKNDPKNLFENKRQLEYSPAKYNGKLMNSIWGFYNRYSPHNIKSNDFESKKDDYFMQQPTAVASYTIAHNMTMAIESGNEWHFQAK